MKKYLPVIIMLFFMHGCASLPEEPALLAKDPTLNKSPTQMGIHYLTGHGVRQDQEKAFYYFSKAAEDGDPFAENELGFMYAAGKGIAQDYEKSLQWYTKAAEHGLASAQYNLGLMYLHGVGTIPNQAIALTWLKKSAQTGFEPAVITLKNYNQ